MTTICQSIKSAANKDIQCTAAAKNGTDFCGRHQKSKIYFKLPKSKSNESDDESDNESDDESIHLPEPEPEPDELVIAPKIEKPKKGKPGPKKGAGISINTEDNHFKIYSYQKYNDDSQRGPLLILFTSSNKESGILIKWYENPELVISIIENSIFNKDYLYANGIFQNILFDPHTKIIKETGNKGIEHPKIKKPVKFQCETIKIEKAPKKDITKYLQDNSSKIDFEWDVDKSGKKIILAKLRELCIENDIKEIERYSSEESHILDNYILDFIDKDIKEQIISFLKDTETLLIEDHFAHSSDEEAEDEVSMEVNTVESLYMNDTVFHHLEKKLKKKSVNKSDECLLVYPKEIESQRLSTTHPLGELIEIDNSTLKVIYSIDSPITVQERSFIITTDICYNDINYSVCIASGFALKSDSIDKRLPNQICERLYLIKKVSGINHVSISENGLDFSGTDYSFIIAKLTRADEESVKDEDGNKYRKRKGENKEGTFMYKKIVK